jgi:hypothetical protein
MDRSYAPSRNPSNAWTQKFEARNPKSETNSKHEIPMFQTVPWVAGVRIRLRNQRQASIPGLSRCQCGSARPRNHRRDVHRKICERPGRPRPCDEPSRDPTSRELRMGVSVIRFLGFRICFGFRASNFGFPVWPACSSGILTDPYRSTIPELPIIPAASAIFGDWFALFLQTLYAERSQSMLLPVLRFGVS